MKLSKKLKKGFTLVELVVVIAIIAILSGVSVAVYVGITDNAKKSAASQEAEQVAMVVRAAALMNANGYTEQTYTGSARYHVDWQSEGLKITALVDGGISADDVIKDIFVEVEKVDAFPGKSIVVYKAADDPINTIAKDDYAVAISFEYTTSSDYSASASFVA